MGALFDNIRVAVAEDRYVLSDHAVDSLSDRRLEEWQVAVGLANGRLLNERPRDKPNPSVEVDQALADGAAVKVIWAWLPVSRVAMLVTVHFYDP